MIALFEKKNTDLLIISISLIHTLAMTFLAGVSSVTFLINWAVAGGCAFILWDIIEKHRLASLGRNHSRSIAWALISLMLNFVAVNFPGETHDFRSLSLLVGFISFLYISIESWQLKIAPLHYLILGTIVGLLSTYYSFCLYWLLLFPALFYFMRSWSKHNLASLGFGFFFSIWLRYIIQYLIFGEASADNIILSYLSVIEHLIPDTFNYNIYEWIFIAITALLIIIYSIMGFAVNMTKTVKASATITMLSLLSLIISIISIVDISHLTNYIAILALFMSAHMTNLQSYANDIKIDIFILIILLVYAVLDILPIILPLFL